MRSSKLISLLLAAFLSFSLAGCAAQAANEVDSQDSAQVQEQAQPAVAATQSASNRSLPLVSVSAQRGDAALFSLGDVPAYSGAADVAVNGDEPFFTSQEIAYAESNLGYESYGQRDAIGRCTAAIACVGPDTMPAKGEKRGSIGMVKPTGWHTITYEGVDGRYLYNRCHLIAWCLGAENANEDNLITGTRYMNTEGMLPTEERVANYIDRTGNHVLYRATPVFEGDNLVAMGVLLEARSVEDSGAGINLCRWCYNVQPGISINYVTGDSWLAADGVDAGSANAAGKAVASSSQQGASTTAQQAEDAQDAANTQTYILNTSTKKFHKPGCSAAAKMSGKNKSEVAATRDSLIAQGYAPCGICKP